MRVSFNWLREYVNLDLSPEELGHRLTMVGLELEEIVDRYAYLDQVITVRIVDAAPIPDPENQNLTVCRIHDGQAERTVVCGAPNARPGLVSALALPGAVLPSGDTIKTAMRKGHESQGMLCSEAELMIGAEAGSLVELPEDTPLGRSLAQALGLADWVLEIGITPNRPDCLSVLGIAREVAGILGARVKYPRIDLREDSTPVQDLAAVDILAPEHCPRYVARVIRGVKIGPSPFWLVHRLAAAGVRSINNVVDVTNYVLMEMGQPLHAFDLDFLEEKRIVVALAQDGDQFTTLDGAERTLAGNMLMIRDGKKPVALAGVMGGLNSEITDQTRDVLLESAYFTPRGVRRTSKKLGLSTEASYRFERGMDPDLCARAADRAAALIAEVSGGRVALGRIDAYPLVQEKRTIAFSPQRCNAFLGTDHSPDEMAGRLRSIELAVTAGGTPWSVSIPSFRVDLYREVDLFEEVARLVGFDRVPAELPAARAKRVPPETSYRLREQARHILEGMGLSEAVNFSFIAENFPDALQLAPDDRRRRTVRIVNPLSEDQVLLRTTLIPGLLDTLRRNQSRLVWDAALYEIGMVFFLRPEEELPEERLTIGGLLSGMREDLSWHKKPEPVDFYDLKGVVEELLEGLGVAAPEFQPDASPFLDPAVQAGILSGNRRLGFLGRVNAETARTFGIKKPGSETGGEAWVFELDLAAIIEAREALVRYKPLPRFPFVDRDLAVMVDRNIPAARITAFVLSLGETILTDVMPFDAYEGKQIAEGQRSLAFRMRYQSPDRTLTDEEVNDAHQKVTDRVAAEFQAVRR